MFRGVRGSRARPGGFAPDKSFPVRLPARLGENGAVRRPGGRSVRVSCPVRHAEGVAQGHRPSDPARPLPPARPTRWREKGWPSRLGSASSGAGEGESALWRGGVSAGAPEGGSLGGACPRGGTRRRSGVQGAEPPPGVGAEPRRASFHSPSRVGGWERFVGGRGGAPGGRVRWFCWTRCPWAPPPQPARSAIPAESGAWAGGEGGSEGAAALLRTRGQCAVQRREKPPYRPLVPHREP